MGSGAEPRPKTDFSDTWAENRDVPLKSGRVATLRLYCRHIFNHVDVIGPESCRIRGNNEKGCYDDLGNQGRSLPSGGARGLPTRGQHSPTGV